MLHKKGRENRRKKRKKEGRKKEKMKERENEKRKEKKLLHRTRLKSLFEVFRHHTVEPNPKKISPSFSFIKILLGGNLGGVPVFIKPLLNKTTA